MAVLCGGTNKMVVLGGGRNNMVVLVGFRDPVVLLGGGRDPMMVLGRGRDPNGAFLTWGTITVNGSNANRSSSKLRCSQVKIFIQYDAGA